MFIRYPACPRLTADGKPQSAEEPEPAPSPVTKGHIPVNLSAHGTRVLGRRRGSAAHVRQLVDRGDTDKQTALEFAPDPEKLKMAFKGIKVSAPGIL